MRYFIFTFVRPYAFKPIIYDKKKLIYFEKNDKIVNIEFYTMDLLTK